MEQRDVDPRELDDLGRQSDDAVLSILFELGRAREADERFGGAAWAEFRDWCWAVEEEPSLEALEVYLECYAADLSSETREELRSLVTRFGNR
ncbi:MAG: hypothetical protein ACXVXO_14890 [Mycobacteriaceae bacterium]